MWDLRTLKLQRCVPCLDSAVLTWNAAGDCGYATLRRASDDLGAALVPKRAKHSLHAAFRTVSLWTLQQWTALLLTVCAKQAVKAHLLREGRSVRAAGHNGWPER